MAAKVHARRCERSDRSRPRQSRVAQGRRRSSAARSAG